MRRLLLGASVAAAMALPATAMAAQSAVTTTNLNLRAGPGVEYPAVDTIPEGARLRIRGCISGYNWCDVVWHGERGWAQGDYLAALYRGHRVVVIDEGPEIGLPIIAFNIGTYWRSHYRHRHFYARIDQFRSGRTANVVDRHSRDRSVRIDAAQQQPTPGRAARVNAVQQRRAARINAASRPANRRATVGVANPRQVQRLAAPQIRAHAPHATANFGNRGQGHVRAQTVGAAPHAAPAPHAPAPHAAAAHAPGGKPGHGGGHGGDHGNGKGHQH
jgi:uncharacterized protein YraI